jgi:hypothetical protein
VLALDRMAIEEAGPNPERLAAAIHEQLRHKSGEIPVAAIAAALDIVEIKEAPLQNLEGALIAPDDRNVGAIAVNRESSPARRRSPSPMNSAIFSIRGTGRTAAPDRSPARGRT